jgi:hypothetical protein
MAKTNRSLNLPPRRESRFRESELARAVRAAKAAGGERVDIDPKTGRISVILTKPGGEIQASDFDLWKEKRQKDAHQA